MSAGYLASARPFVGRFFTPSRLRAASHGLVVAGIVVAVAAGIHGFVGQPPNGPAPDAVAYWSARSPNLYGQLPGTIGAYLYSPAFAQLIAPLQALPLQLFVALWLVAILVVMGWLTGPRLLAIAVALSWSEIESGNIHIFLAAAIVIGFRYAAAWALLLLTKVTPGVALVWFARRREWRALVLALGTTLVIAVVSWVADPTSWSQWVGLLTRSAAAPSQSLSGLVPLWLRIGIGAVVAWWGAGRNARWTVPIAAMLALPVIWPGSLTLLLAMVPLSPRWSAVRGSWREAFA